jgi:hypothetical protein
MRRTDAYRQWQKRYTLFKRSVRVLAKLGVLDTMCQEVRATTSQDMWNMPDWDEPHWTDALYRDIVSGQVSPAVLDGLIRSCRIDWWGAPHPSAVETLAALDRLYCRYGKDFRARYEVSVLRGERVEDMGKPTTGDGGVPAQELPGVRQELGDAGDSTARAEVPT